MAKITRENVLLIENAELLAIVRREEKGIVIYKTDKCNMEMAEKLLNHLVGTDETPDNSESSK